MSCYAPLWVKTDQARFPRARDSQGKAQEILTPFSSENLNADKRAFVELMKHVRMVDADFHTVLLVQVENEIGMIPDARDHSKEADRAFSANVPPELLKYLQQNKESLTPELRKIWGDRGFKTSGSWEEVFDKGLQTDELFMAWHFARYTNAVAEAGKKEYPLPMYVNAALIRPGYKPGQYPSAGPLPHLFDVWKAAAPAIDFLSPDLYFKNFAEWVNKYDRPGNPLFVPEVSNAQSMTNAFYAFGQLNAMGYSPFSIESLDHPENNQVTKGYDVLKQLTPLILANQGKGTMTAALLDSANQKAELKLGEFVFTVSHEYSWPYAARGQGETPRFGCMIVMVSPVEYYVAGSGVIVTFRTASNDGTIAGIGTMDEGHFVDGKWTPGLRMNGDQSHQGRHMNLPGHTFGIQKVRLYQYK
jgi:beta-galactosidase GanA